MTCSNCGRPRRARFCGHCGAVHRARDVAGDDAAASIAAIHQDDVAKTEGGIAGAVLIGLALFFATQS